MWVRELRRGRKTLLERQPPGIDAKFVQQDPLERRIRLGLKLFVYGFLILIFIQAFDAFGDLRRPWPGLLSILRTFVFLPLHEGGHFLFMFFGRTLHILGGSFWQVIFPFLWFLVALRRKSHVAPFALFWTGENLMDVSLYIRDAPLLWLPLLGGHKSRHDWRNLLSDWNALNSAASIADWTFAVGVVICIGSIAAGVGLAFWRFFRPAVTPARPQPNGQNPADDFRVQSHS